MIGWSAMKGWLIMFFAAGVVFLAASGFVVTNVGDKIVAREGALFVVPAVAVAQRALDDARTARDRECGKVGPICRQREDAVGARQNELNSALAKALGEAGSRADPQAATLGMQPGTLRKLQAGGLVAMCLGAGFVLSLGWGLLFARRPQA